MVAARLLHRRPGRGPRRSSRPTSGRCSAIAEAATRHHRGRRLHRLRLLGAQRHRHDAEVQRRRGRPRRPGPPARAQDAPPQLPLLRRQAVLHAGRSARSRSTSDGRAAARGSASRSAKTCGTSSTTSSRCASWPRKGAGVILNLNASPFYPGQAARARRADPPAHRRGAPAGRLRQHRRAPRTTARTSSRSTARAWSTTSTAGSSRSAASSPRTCSSSTSTGATPQPALDLPPIDRDREIYDALVMALATTCARPASRARSWRCRAASIRRWRWRSRSTRSAPGRSPPSTCRRSYNTETTRVDRRAAGRRVRGELRRDPDPGASTTRSSRSVRGARPPDRAQPDPREPPRAHPRPADDGGVERHRRAAHLLRQRDRDRARLRHALRRHVRRDLAHRRSLEDGRLPAGPLRQPAARRRDASPRRPSTSSRPRSSRTTNTIRSTTPSSRRSSASWSSGG